jgi:hypothetical protein
MSLGVFLIYHALTKSQTRGTVLVCGDSDAALLLVGILCSKRYKVHVYTEDITKWRNSEVVVQREGHTKPHATGRPHLVTDNAVDACKVQEHIQIAHMY